MPVNATNTAPAIPNLGPMPQGTRNATAPATVTATADTFHAGSERVSTTRSFKETFANNLIAKRDAATAGTTQELPLLAAPPEGRTRS